MRAKTIGDINMQVIKLQFKVSVRVLGNPSEFCKLSAEEQKARMAKSKEIVSKLKEIAERYKSNIRKCALVMDKTKSTRAEMSKCGNDYPSWYDHLAVLNRGTINNILVPAAIYMQR